MSGYFEIGVYHPKTEQNIGTLWRSAYQMGATGVFTIGRRYHRMASDTCNTPRQIPLRHYLTLEEFLANRPVGALLIGIEMGGRPLSRFCHPKAAVYLLGAEDHGLPGDVLTQCNDVISLEAVRQPSFNVSVAGSIVMYDRVFNRTLKPATPEKEADDE